MTYQEVKNFMKSIEDTLLEGNTITISAKLMSGFDEVIIKIIPKEEFSKPRSINPVGAWEVDANGKFAILTSNFSYDEVLLKTDTGIKIPITPENIIR